MFAGIDIASERHMLARLGSAGKPIGRPIAFTEDHAGYTRLAEALGPPPVLVAMEATGHYWKNLFAVLTAAGHDVALLNPFTARRFQDASLERTKTDTIDAEGLARLAFEKRPASTQLHDTAAESLRELVRHRDRLRQDEPSSAIGSRTMANDDRVRQLHRLVDLGFPEFTRHVRSLDSMLATALIAEYPTAQAFARANPRRLAKLRYDGCHFVGPDLAEWLVAAAKHSVARIIAAVGDPARFRGAGAFAAHVGVVPGLRQSGKQSARTRAPISPMGNTRLRKALWMPVLGAVRRNPSLRAVYERLRAAGKPAKLALIAAMRKRLNAVSSVARNRKPFVIGTDKAQAA